MTISTYALTKAIHVPAPRISEIVAGRRAITADTGLRLSRFFHLNDGFWVSLQQGYDLALARDAPGDELEEIWGPAPFLFVAEELADLEADTPQNH